MCDESQSWAVRGASAVSKWAWTRHSRQASSAGGRRRIPSAPAECGQQGRTGERHLQQGAVGGCPPHAYIKTRSESGRKRQLIASSRIWIQASSTTTSAPAGARRLIEIRSSATPPSGVHPCTRGGPGAVRLSPARISEKYLFSSCRTSARLGEERDDHLRMNRLRYRPEFGQDRSRQIIAWAAGAGAIGSVLLVVLFRRRRALSLLPSRSDFVASFSPLPVTSSRGNLRRTATVIAAGVMTSATLTWLFDAPFAPAAGRRCRRC